MFPSVLKTISLVITRLSFAGILLLGGCSDSDAPVLLGDPPDPPLTSGETQCVTFNRSTNFLASLVEAAKSIDDAQQFVELLIQIDQEDLKGYTLLATPGNGEFTLLLPTDDAFARFKKAYADVPLTGVNLISLVEHHVLYDEFPFTELVRGNRFRFARAMNREAMPIRIDNRNCIIFGDDARLIEADDFCANGVIHRISEVAVPKKNFR